MAIDKGKAIEFNGRNCSKEKDFDCVHGVRPSPRDEKLMYEVKIVTDFAAAHNLRNFRGRCENLHGHNWKVEVVVRGDRLDQAGVLLDFGELKQATRQVLQQVDHQYLNDLPYFKERNPSSEHIARFLFESLAARINGDHRWVFSVSAWESKDSCATYYGESR
ncbi:preQ(0) biosynthesis protein QueD [Desulfacinum hydrothermale DSM 13146]|uniref:6-carboxy-5,6,7,8-tetrahydropterin synthase n=2 Tax=Desulfacinum hydrothermale TaxID=109258 RepID=A0A1W1XMX6_9BACT|nr:preQ(0) biosynthesis protein QueD [Desulfacinum hydrothermale DSM 13146]